MKQEDIYMIKEDLNQGHNQMQSQLLNILQKDFFLIKKSIKTSRLRPDINKKNKNKNIFLRSAPEFMVENPV